MHHHATGTSGKGLCGLLPAAAFSDGTVRPHEKTLTARLQRQTALVTNDRGALGKPVLITTRHLGNTWSDLGRTHTADEISVRFRGRETDYELRELHPRSRQFPVIDLAALGTLVIADGHHRAATHARLAASGLSSCALVPVCLIGIDDLQIGIFLRQLAGYTDSPESLRTRLGRYFSISEVNRSVAPVAPDKWLMTYRGRHFELVRTVSAAGYTTHTAWFVGEVLTAVFGVRDPSTSDLLENIPVDALPDGTLDLPDTAPLSFAGCPISTDLFFREVEAGRTLPPKSTRFMPRVPSGLVVWKGC